MRVSFVLAALWIVLAATWLVHSDAVGAPPVLAVSAVLVAWLLLRPAGLARLRRVFRRS
jgi:hypothetical protein